MQPGHQWIVDVDASLREPVTEDAMGALLDALEAVGAQDASVAGGLGSEVGATFGVVLPPETLVWEVARIGVGLLSVALAKASLPQARPVRVAVQTADEHERELERRADEWSLLGLTEIAGLLGVSKQRVDQLRRERGDSPQPVAELAAGPVWKLSMLKRFIAGWQRKPGRPRKIQHGAEAESKTA